jgi:hypothetical protein
VPIGRRLSLAAAVLAVVAGTLIAFAFRSREPARPSVSGRAPQHGNSAQSDPTKDRLQHTGPSDNSPLLAVDAGPYEDPIGTPSPPRDPTPYERLVMLAAFKPHATSERPLSIRKELIRRLASVDHADVNAAKHLAAGLGISSEDLERELRGLCLNLRGLRRQAAIGLLSREATASSLNVLLELFGQPPHQEQVTPAIARLADRRTLARCYQEAGASTSRAILAESLMRQSTPGDVGLLLELLHRSRESTELLAALSHANNAVASALFAELAAPSRAVRYAAARSLGAMNRPEITRRLVDLVVRGERRQEALVALAGSDEPTAAMFVERVQRDAVLAAALQSALVQAGTSQVWYGG